MMLGVTLQWISYKKEWKYFQSLNLTEARISSSLVGWVIRPECRLNLKEQRRFGERHCGVISLFSRISIDKLAHSNCQSRNKTQTTEELS